MNYEQPMHAVPVAMLEYERRIAELESELAELRADKERIDWLEAYLKAGVWSNVLIEGGIASACDSRYQYQDEITHWHAPTIRAAIDAARKGTS